MIYRSADFVVASRDEETSGVAFQLTVNHRPPTWPEPDVRQQMDLDVMVDDLEAADAAVVALGPVPSAASTSTPTPPATLSVSSDAPPGQRRSTPYFCTE